MLSFVAHPSHLKVVRVRPLAAMAVRAASFHTHPVARRNQDSIPSPVDDAADAVVDAEAEDKRGPGRGYEEPEKESLFRLLGLRNGEGSGANRMETLEFAHVSVKPYSAGTDDRFAHRRVVNDYAVRRGDDLTDIQYADYSADIDSWPLYLLKNAGGKWDQPYMSDEEMFTSFDEEEKKPEDLDKLKDAAEDNIEWKDEDELESGSDERPAKTED